MRDRYHWLRTRLPRLLAVEILALLAAASAATFFALALALRHDFARQAAAAHAQTAARIAATRISETFQAYDTALQSIIESRALYPDSTEARLLYASSARSVPAEFVDVLDKDGVITFESRGRNFPGSFAGRDYFQHHRNGGHFSQLYAGGLFRNLPPDLPLFSLSRRLDKADGSFDGVVMAAVNARVLKDILADARVGTHGAAALCKDDGSIIARAPFHLNDFDIKADTSAPPPASIDAADFGLCRGLSSDPQPHLFRTAAVQHHQIHVWIGVSASDLEAEFTPPIRHDVMGSGLAVLSALLSVASIVARRIRDRERLHRTRVAETKIHTFQHGMLRDFDTRLNAAMVAAAHGFGEASAAYHPSAMTLPHFLDVRDSCEQVIRFGMSLFDEGPVPAAIEARETNLSAFTDQCFRLFTPLANQKGLDYQISPPLQRDCVADVDSLHLRRAIYHLLQNAFSRTDIGRITLSLQTRPPEIQFMIADSGRPLTPDERNAIADKDGHLRTSPGWLGMASSLHHAAALACLMKGSATVQSNNGGCSFFLTIPAATASQKPSPDRPPGQGRTDSTNPDPEPGNGNSRT